MGLIQRFSRGVAVAGLVITLGLAGLTAKSVVEAKNCRNEEFGRYVAKVIQGNTYGLGALIAGVSTAVAIGAVAYSRRE